MLLSCGGSNKMITPKLLVVISVDQMSASYLDDTEFMPRTHGSLFSTSAVFTQMHHYHARTTTAAGHATLATGCYPSTHGIVDNNVYVRFTGVTEYSILDTSIHFIGVENCNLKKVSAARLQRPTLGDIVKSKNAKSKSYSVALKDRSSILMGGKDANRAFWFDAESIRMVSSDYYNERFPDWALSFSGDSTEREALATGWIYNTPYDVTKLDGDSASYECGKFLPWFPHTLASLDTLYVSHDRVGNFLWNTPFGDHYVLEFAKQLIAKEELGQDEQCDVLTIGLSAADIIGHQFGPNSREIADYYYRLDSYIEEFIAYLDATVGEGNYTLALTADHGVAPMPEFPAIPNSERIEHTQFDDDLERIDHELQVFFELTRETILESSYSGVEPHFQYLINNNVDTSAYVALLKEKLQSLHYIAGAYSPADYLVNDGSFPLAHLRNSYDPRYGYFIQTIPQEGYLVDMRSCGTTHGTPYSYDTHVPFIIYGAQVSAMKTDNTVYTVDIAPTLLHILGIDEVSMDGKNLLN
jgi:predicted AlkP superfamily pyrophosphatase or phosphodiesterase